jgi:inosine-uridine nucleoside N-ribohydrolase
MIDIRKLIIDCDPAFGVPGADVDDCLAILLALRWEKVSLELVTVVAGNVQTSIGMRGLRYLLSLAARPDIEVLAGAERPLLEDDRAWRQELEGRGGRELAVRLWSGHTDVATGDVEGPAAPGVAIRRIAEKILAAPGEIDLVCLGPLTNAALALKTYPEIGESVRSIVVMGGAIALPGSGNELNFCYDPEAAHIVLASGAPVVVVPLDITRTTFFTPQENARLRSNQDAAVRAVGEAAAPWIEWVRAERGLKGCHLHDPLAVAIALDPSLATTQRMGVAVELSGQYGRGRLVTWTPEAKPLRPDRGPPEVRADIVQTIATDRFYDRFRSVLGLAVDA